LVHIEARLQGGHHRSPSCGCRQQSQGLGYTFDFNEAARRTITHFTSEQNPVEVSLRRYGSVPLDSRTSILSCAKRLAPGEIERIRRETHDVCPQFYAERDWDVQAPTSP